MNVVVDASVTLKWLLRARPTEQDVPKALSLLKAIGDGVCEAFQPAHWRAEVLAVIARENPMQIDEAIRLIYRLPHTPSEDPIVLRRAAQQADALKQHLFDTLYHAVAIERRAVLITSDVRYYTRAKDVGSIQLLRDFMI